MNDCYDQLKTLLMKAERPPEDTLILGASDRDLLDAETSLGGPLPAQLKTWLRVVNGTFVGGIAILGIKSERSYLDMLEVLLLYPNWKEKHWYPVASDGCGNYYVLVSSSERHPVAFVDVHEDPETLTYLVASELTVFIRRLVESELSETRWPFDRAFVLSQDPNLSGIPIAPLPWEK